MSRSCWSFYDFPAEHCATVRHRQKLTRGPGSRAAGIARGPHDPKLTEDQEPA
jgi:hypothetical protein